MLCLLGVSCSDLIRASAAVIFELSTFILVGSSRGLSLAATGGGILKCDFSLDLLWGRRWTLLIHHETRTFEISTVQISFTPNKRRLSLHKAPYTYCHANYLVWILPANGTSISSLWRTFGGNEDERVRDGVSCRKWAVSHYAAHGLPIIDHLPAWKHRFFRESLTTLFVFTLQCRCS